MGLKKYKAKRDFRKTAEPKGGKPLPKAVRGASRFVIQKHDARRLHYDLRLHFEGVIPEGNYGGGTVMVWDRGTYYVYGEQPAKSFQEDKLHLVLDGKKARG